MSEEKRTLEQRELLLSCAYIATTADEAKKNAKHIVERFQARILKALDDAKAEETEDGAPSSIDYYEQALKEHGLLP